jgi:Ca2+-binding EF-hand superfamily protein
VSTQPNPQKQQEVIARNVFNKFDEDNSGSISTAEFIGLIEFLGADFSDSEVAEAIKEIDQDESGLIDREEFVRWWTNQSSSRAAGGLVAIKLRKLANKAM